MAKTGPITSKQAEALSQAMGRHFAQAGKGPDRPVQGETRRPITRDLLKRAQQALLKLADGRGSQLEEWERRDLAEYLDRIRGSDAISQTPDASSALHTASEALRALTAPARPAAPRPTSTSTRSTPSYLETPQWPGSNATPEQAYDYRVRSEWRNALHSMSGLVKEALDRIGLPIYTTTTVQIEWRLLDDETKRLRLRVTVHHGEIQRMVLIDENQSGGGRLEYPLGSYPDAARHANSYERAEGVVVSSFTTPYFQRHPAPRPPLHPNDGQVVWRGLVSIFGGETAGERFDRETRAYQQAVNGARREIYRAPTPNFLSPIVSLEGGSDPSPASPAGDGGGKGPFPPVSYRGGRSAPVSTARDDDVLLADPARGGAVLFDFAVVPAGAVEPVVPLESLPAAVRRPPLLLP